MKHLVFVQKVQNGANSAFIFLLFISRIMCVVCVCVRVCVWDSAIELGLWQILVQKLYTADQFWLYFCIHLVLSETLFEDAILFL